MDYPSEENLIRIKLDGITSVKNLEFDIPNRRLTVFHMGAIEQIEKSIYELNLGSRKLSTELTNQTDFLEDSKQKRLLLDVLPKKRLFLKSSLNGQVLINQLPQTPYPKMAIPNRL